MRQAAKEAAAELHAELQWLEGRTIQRIELKVAKNSMDPGCALDGLSVSLDDGSIATFRASWCNDGTADLWVERGEAA